MPIKGTSGIKFQIGKGMLNLTVERDNNLPIRISRELSRMTRVIEGASHQMETACQYFCCFERLPYSVIIKPIISEIKIAAERLETTMKEHGLVRLYPVRFSWRFWGSKRDQIDFCLLASEYWFGRKEENET